MIERPVLLTIGTVEPNFGLRRTYLLRGFVDPLSRNYRLDSLEILLQLLVERDITRSELVAEVQNVP